MRPVVRRLLALAAAPPILALAPGCAAHFGEAALDAGSISRHASQLPPARASACLRRDLDRGPIPPQREARGGGERTLIGVLAMDPRVWLYRVVVRPAEGGGALIEAQAANPGYPMSDWWEGELHLLTEARIADRLAKAADACAG